MQQTAKLEMRLLRLCGLLAAATGLVRGDADFMSVRTSMAKDYSGKGGDPAEKYFRECSCPDYSLHNDTDQQVDESTYVAPRFL